jgi:hypothetical protein
LTRVAADDKLLLSHSQDNLIDSLAQDATVEQAAYMFDSSTYLIGKLEAIQLDTARSWEEADAGCRRLKQEAYIANLLHLLRRLQHILFQVLVHRSITRLDEFARHWQTYWQQKKKLGQDWFTEWPSGERPLSTTWPWNIRPSLVVLWGVCWMFYYNEQANENKPRSPAVQQLVDDSINWTLSRIDSQEAEQGTRHSERAGSSARLTTRTVRQIQAGLANDTRNLHTTIRAQTPPTQAQVQAQAQARTGSSPRAPMQAAAGQNLNLTSLQPLSAGAQPHSAHPYQGGQFGYQFGYQLGDSPFQSRTSISPAAILDEQPGAKLRLGISPSTADVPRPALFSTSPSPHVYEKPSPLLSPRESRDFQSEWQTSRGGNIPTSPYASLGTPSNVWPEYHQQAPSSFNSPRPSLPTFQVSPVGGHSFAPTLDLTNNQALFQPYLRPAFGQNQDMGDIESYPSPHSEGGRQASITTPISMPESVITDHLTTPSIDANKGLHISINRGEPPRNKGNQIYCSHPKCAKEVPIFRRPCEWK